MPRFFIAQTLPSDQMSVSLDGEDARHLSTVLRMGIGDELILCDGARTDYLARIREITSTLIQLDILTRQSNQTESPLDIRIFQGLPKSDKLDEIIQKAVELGASRITPVACARSVVRIDAKDASRKADRWSKIAQAAAKQCGRGILPIVDRPVSFSAALDECRTADLTLLAWEGEREHTLKSVLQQQEPRLRGLIDQRIYPRICVVIGPEGGFSGTEVQQAILAGCVTVSLGRRILRTQTAAPAILAMLGYQFDDF